MEFNVEFFLDNRMFVGRNLQIIRVFLCTEGRENQNYSICYLPHLSERGIHPLIHLLC